MNLLMNLLNFIKVLCFCKRASVPKFSFGSFRPSNAPSSAHRAVPELRIELPATLEHARGPEIG